MKTKQDLIYLLQLKAHEIHKNANNINWYPAGHPNCNPTDLVRLEASIADYKQLVKEQAGETWLVFFESKTLNCFSLSTLQCA
jgi:hypothetical protein